MRRGLSGRRRSMIWCRTEPRVRRPTAAHTRSSAGGQGFGWCCTDEFHALHNNSIGRIQHARLSQAAVEVLSLVAYNGSLSGDEVAKLRGKPTGAILARLLRRQLLTLEREVAESRVVRIGRRSVFRPVWPGTAGRSASQPGKGQSAKGGMPRKNGVTSAPNRRLARKEQHIADVAVQSADKSSLRVCGCGN